MTNAARPRRAGQGAVDAQSIKKVTEICKDASPEDAQAALTEHNGDVQAAVMSLLDSARPLSFQLQCEYHQYSTLDSYVCCLCRSLSIRGEEEEATTTACACSGSSPCLLHVLPSPVAQRKVVCRLKGRSVTPIGTFRTETTIAVVTTEAEAEGEAEVAIGRTTMDTMDLLPVAVGVEVRVAAAFPSTCSGAQAGARCNLSLIHI